MNLVFSQRGKVEIHVPAAAFRMEYLPQVDELVMEYLLFRGFTQSFQAFHHDRKNDKSKRLDVEKLVSQLLFYIEKGDISSLMGLWSFLRTRFLCHLDNTYAQTITKLDISLKRSYLIHAMQSGQSKLVLDFFYKNAEQLQQENIFEDNTNDISWSKWFILPFLTSPQTDTYFKKFFSSEWMTSFTISLRNFLALTFQHMPLPKLLSFKLSHLEEQSLKMQLEVAKDEIDRLRFLRLLSFCTLRIEIKRVLCNAFIRIDDLVDQNSQLEEKLKKVRLSGSNLYQMISHIVTEDQEERISSETLSQIPCWLTLYRKLFQEQHLQAKSQDIENYDENKTSILVEQNLKSSSSFLMQNSHYDESNKPFTSTSIFSSHKAGILCCKFSCDGNFIASGGKDATVRLWSLKSNQGLETTIFSHSAVLSLDWYSSSHDDHLLLYGTSERTICFWSLTKRSQLASVLLDTFYPQIVALECCKSDGVFVCSLSKPSQQYGQSPSGLLQVWDIKTTSLRQTLPFEPRNVVVNAISLSQNGNLLLSGADDGIIRIYDIRQSTALIEFQASQESLVGIHFTTDEMDLLTVGAKDNNIIQWSMKTMGNRGCSPEIVYKYDIIPVNNKERCHIAFNEDGKQFIINTSSSSAFIYKSGHSSFAKELRGHNETVLAVDWHPHLPLCITASEDRTLRLWEEEHF